MKAQDTYETALGTVLAFPRDIPPTELLEYLTELQLDGVSAEAWHPWWGHATRIQHLVEIATGVPLAGRPFILVGKEAS